MFLAKITRNLSFNRFNARKAEKRGGWELALFRYADENGVQCVDCDGTRLTVWLLGKADRFSVGDSVTVTYNGEPATAYHIWPGQLVSVE